LNIFSPVEMSKIEYRIAALIP